MTKLDLFLILTVISCTFLSGALVVMFFKHKDRVKALAISLICILGISAVILYPERARVKKRLNVVSQHVPIRIFNSHHCSCSSLKPVVSKDLYQLKHRPMAIKTTRNGYIKTAGIRGKFLRNKKLVPVAENEGYWIPFLSHSTKHLTPTANKRLIELGRRFRSSLKQTENKKDYFVVSSITRTQAQQDDLRKRDPGATKGKSTHSFGVSFDISEVRSKDSCKKGMDALKKILLEMRKEGKILLCPENDCIHITVIK
jgi:hypothetical protein